MGAIPNLASQLTTLDEATHTIHQYERGEQEEPWGYSIRALPDESVRLDVSGRGSTNWLPGLCNDLFQMHVNISSGDVYRTEKGCLRGSLSLDAPGRPGRPFTLDVMSCLRRPGWSRSGDSISLGGYRLEPTPGRTDSLLLEIEAFDRRGFLGNLFATLAPLGLDLREARVSTVDRKICDRFLFDAPGGEVERTRRRLVHVLEPLVDSYWAS